MSTLAKEFEHIKRHVTYPTGKSELVAACNNMMDVPADDKDWFTRTLPERSYKSAEEVMTELVRRV